MVKFSASSTEAEKSVENSSSENTCKNISTFDNIIAINDNSLIAEIIWYLKVVNAHWSYNSSLCYTYIAKLFQCMFPDSEIASQFSMGQTKSRYVILYVLAPHFKSRLREAINSSIYYSLSFDESLNYVEQKCQMDVNVRFLNECRNIVETRYYNSKFLDRPNAENLLESIRDVSIGLQQENFLQLAMDGPNLNWEVLKKTDEMLVKNDYSKTINIGSCPHSVFKTWTMNNWDVHKILKSMF